MNNTGIVNDNPDYGDEIELVRNRRFSVRSGLRDGRVSAAYIRVVDDDYGECAYWSLEELTVGSDGSGSDYATALNAALSAIQLVASGQYPPPAWSWPKEEE